ncbi:hypothetical protein ONS95_008805 [Cadophora gregata]|uniref:uncharacterized protein n=1 Tax=Cadophora gregata TaxID=51156 RepID=UPI0026DBC9C5|nr:uncharacterized protein ONS95_008805 [Cadophora gregata]KAK0123808.1 hypothetical protein ONS95_008805 [Cadophora gregata]
MADVDLTQNRQGELRATTIAITLLAVFFVVLRFISRRMKGIGIGADDIMILVALFFLFAASVTCIIGVEYGLGKHMAALSLPEIVSYAKSLIAFECLYVTCVCFTKIALLLMYLRIFPVRSIQIGAYVLSALSISWCISIIMVSIFQCTPIARTWNPTLPGHCINLKGSFIGNAIPNILTDVAILALPMQQVWSLHTSTMQKAQISFVFLLGSFVIFTSIYRFTTLFQFQPADITWTLATAEVWCVVESASGIISACLPTLGHLIQVCSRKLGVTSGLTWSSRARTPDPSTQLQTIGGGGGKSNNSKIMNSGTYDDIKLKTNNQRPFRRLSGQSAMSGLTEEQNDWEQHSNMKSTVRTHDVESVGSDEVPLRKIVIKTELEWQETTKKSDGGYF